MRLLLFALLATASPVFAQKSGTTRQAVLSVLDAQAKAWNAGDMEAFMEGYWRSDSLQFIGSQGIVYGWQATLDRYRTRYPDAAARGTLRFDILQVELLGKDAAFVIGRFHLARPQAGDASGHFTLLFRKMGGKWRIVVDHT